MADEIDLSWNTFGKVKDMVKGVIGEQGRALVTGNGELVLNVSQGSSEIERTQVESGRNALGKRLVNGEMQSVAEFRVTHQEQSAEGLAIHFG